MCNTYFDSIKFRLNKCENLNIIKIESLPKKKLKIKKSTTLEVLIRRFRSITCQYKIHVAGYMLSGAFKGHKKHLLTFWVFLTIDALTHY